jgi:hypothetical protein
MTWKSVNKKQYLIYLVGSLALLAVVGQINCYFLHFIEQREGVVLYDPILELFPARDLSTPIFIVLYSSITAGWILASRHPKLLIRVLLAFSIMYLIRMACIYVVPLNPPQGLIPIKDEIINLLLDSQVFIEKDLFFSGHFACVFIFFLVFDKKFYRWYFLLFAMLIATLLMIQHVHYSYDIIGAIVFCYIAVFIARKIQLQFWKNVIL